MIRPRRVHQDEDGRSLLPSDEAEVARRVDGELIDIVDWGIGAGGALETDGSRVQQFDLFGCDVA
jgi:hypothetical protein